MNIYNKLFFIEYTREPIKSSFYKFWRLNLSNNNFFYLHRDFDLYAAILVNIKDINKTWYKYSNLHRYMYKTNIRVHRNNNTVYCQNYYIKNYCDQISRTKNTIMDLLI